MVLPMLLRCAPAVASSAFPLCVRALPISGRQFGIFCTRNVPRGEVVYCESTPVVVHFSDVSAREQLTGACSYGPKYGSAFTSWEALEQAMLSKHVGRWMRLLAPRTPSDVWPITAELRDRVNEETGLGRAVLAYATGGVPSPEPADPALLSMLVAKAQKNMFVGGYDSGEAFSLLCTLGSFFNHSCAANCHYVTGSDASGRGFLRVFTIRDVKAGEELTIPYATVAFNSFSARTVALTSRAMACWCSFCAAARAGGKDPVASVTTTFGNLPLSGCLWCGGETQPGAWSCCAGCAQRCKSDLKDFVEPTSLTPARFAEFARVFQRAMSPEWTKVDAAQDAQFIQLDRDAVVEWLEARVASA